MNKRPRKGSQKETKSPRFNSVEEYLASLESEPDRHSTKARTLRSVIDFILAEFPELESKISWNVPTIHRKGKYVAGFAAYKHHLTFASWSSRVIEDFKTRLGKFVVKTNCFQIPVDWKIDKKLVKDLVQARLAEVDSSRSSFLDPRYNNK
jgi:uncharacterized protein